MQQLGRTPAILFPANMVANADPNALDDYEEAAFTPSLSFATNPSNLTYGATRYGRATKIGRLVQIEGRIVLTSKGTLGSGLVTISGLPYAPQSQGAAGPFRFTGATLTTATGLSGYLTTTSGIALQCEANTGATDATWAMLSNTFDILFAATYAA